MKYLSLLILIAACSPKPKVDEIKFPRVAQNQCGGYAVQMYRDIPQLGHDTTYFYIGKYVERSSGRVIRGTGFWIDSQPDTLQVLISRKHDQIWIGDTIYNSSAGYEIIFSTKDLAQNALNSWLRKTKEESDFKDSVLKCHTYK